jgi:acyl dehydratase
MVGDTHTVIDDMEIERGKVEEFARAVHDDNPIHVDPDRAREQGFDSIPAPLTFTRTGLFPRYWPDDRETFFPFDLGFEAEYTVHGEQRYTYHRQVTVGDVLSCEATLTEVYQRDGGRGGTMTFAVLELAYEDRSDDPVVTETLTLIETGGAIEEDADD